MALLNYISKYEYLKNKDLSSQALVFTGDGHIVTHGIDYIGNVYEYVNNLLSSNDAMLFKGVISKTNSLPKSDYHAGWTYRVQEAGEYAGKNCEVGDLVIAINDSETNQEEINNGHWAVIQSNINGTSTLTLNGSTAYTFYTNDTTNKISFYAPITLGTKEQVLIGGATPTWSPLANLTVGTANKLAKALSLGQGLSFENNNNSVFDGSSAVKVLLNTATKESIGGVIIGENINIDNGKISIPEVDNNIKGVMTPEMLLQLNTNTGNIKTNSDKISGLEDSIKTLTGNVGTLNYFSSVKVGTTTINASGSTTLNFNGNAISVVENAITITDTNTWRPIYLEQQEASIPDNKKLRFISGEGLVMIQDNTNDDEIEIGFDLRWYDLDKGDWENNN